jgi:hypothetical protein
MLFSNKECNMDRAVYRESLNCCSPLRVPRKWIRQALSFFGFLGLSTHAPMQNHT